jgi:hypothetical protein
MNLSRAEWKRIVSARACVLVPLAVGLLLGEVLLPHRGRLDRQQHGLLAARAAPGQRDRLAAARPLDEAVFSYS